MLTSRGNIASPVALGVAVFFIAASAAIQMDRAIRSIEEVRRKNAVESFYMTEMAAWHSYERFRLGLGPQGVQDASGRYIAAGFSNQMNITLGTNSYSGTSYVDGTPVDKNATWSFVPRNVQFYRFPQHLKYEYPSPPGNPGLGFQGKFCGVTSLSSKSEHRRCLAGTWSGASVDIKAGPVGGPYSDSFSISSGSAFDLQWNASVTTTCTVNPGNYTGTSGTATVGGGITVDTSYTLTCTGPLGTLTDTVEITIPQVPGPPTFVTVGMPNFIPSSTVIDPLTENLFINGRQIYYSATSCTQYASWTGGVGSTASQTNWIQNSTIVSRKGSDWTANTAFNGTGRLDHSFGRTNFPRCNRNGGSSISMYPDNSGRFYALGDFDWIAQPGTTTNMNPANVAIARYFSDGRLDTTFNGTGNLVYPKGNLTGSIFLPTGQIITASTRVDTGGPSSTCNGITYTYNRQYNYVTKINSSGTFDTTFSGGSVNPDYRSNAFSTIRNSLMDVNGKIYTAASYGYVQDPCTGRVPDYYASRMDANGVRDYSFNTTGDILAPMTYLNNAYKTMSSPDHADARSLIGFQDLGDGPRLVGTILGELHITLIRFLPNGTLDTSFGASGQKHIVFTGWKVWSANATILPNNKILLTGLVEKGCPKENNIYVARLNADGTWDSSFATNGLFLHPGMKYAFGASLLVQSNGKILITALTSDKIDSCWGYRCCGTEGPLLSFTNGRLGLLELTDNGTLLRYGW